MPERCSVSVEKAVSWSRWPAVTPITVAPCALNLSIASANRCALMLQPFGVGGGEEIQLDIPRSNHRA